MGAHSGGSYVCKLLILKVGERGRNRTFNLLIKSQLLCQLSYAPACMGRPQKSIKIIPPGICRAKGNASISIAEFRFAPQVKGQILATRSARVGLDPPASVATAWFAARAKNRSKRRGERTTRCSAARNSSL